MFDSFHSSCDVSGFAPCGPRRQAHHGCGGLGRFRLLMVGFPITNDLDVGVLNFLRKPTVFFPLLDSKITIKVKICHVWDDCPHLEHDFSSVWICLNIGYPSTALLKHVLMKLPDIPETYFGTPISTINLLSMAKSC